MRALVLGSNAVLVLNVVQSLGVAGIEADVISDWHAPRVRFSRYCRRYVRLPYRSLAELSDERVAWLVRYVRSHAIDLVIPADLASAFGAARLQAAGLRLFPCADAEQLQALHDKWRFHQLLCSLGLPSPPTRLLLPSGSAEALGLKFPVMLKPLASEGSDRVRRYDSVAAIEAMRTESEHVDTTWLVQDFIPGRDIDISLLAEHGQVVAFTIQVDESPGVKQFVHDQRALSVASEVVRATRFHGLAHFDMRIDRRDGELCAIECNPRVWGSLLYSVWAGVNFIELGCRVALEQPLPRIGHASGRVAHQGVAPRRLIKALLHGQVAPNGMHGATLASWKQAHTDPLTQLIGNFTEERETRRRTVQHVRAGERGRTDERPARA
jgi:predicted ATP-grasp superfamily ATP-dependent carboligase